VGNLLFSTGDQRIGLALRSPIWTKDHPCRTAASGFVISVASSTVGLSVRFDRNIGPEGAIVGNDWPFLRVKRSFAPEGTALAASTSTAEVVSAVGAVVMRLGSRHPHVSPGRARASIDDLSMR
jgi:hypothetical protein